MLTPRLVTRGKQMPVDVAQVVRLLVLVHDIWRLTDHDRFFDLSESLIVLYVCPHSVDGMVSLSDMICQCDVFITSHPQF